MTWNRRAALALALALTTTVAWSGPAAAAEATVEAPARPKRPKGKWPWFKRYRKQAEATAPTAAPPAQPRPAAETVTQLPVAPAAAPAAETPERPPSAMSRRTRATAPTATAPAPTATPAGPAPPAPAPAAAPSDASTDAEPPSIAGGTTVQVGSASPLARRRGARVSRATAARDGAAERQVAAATGTPGTPAATRRHPVTRDVRHLHAQARRQLGLAGWGAPPVREITANGTALRELEPLQARVRLLDPLAPVAATAHADFGAALLRHGLETASAAESLLALSLDASLVPAWNNLGTVLRRAGKLDLAEEILEHALRLEPASGVARFNYAMLLDARGKRKDAEVEYVRALELDPSLWLPQRNPLVVGNADAQKALHDLYMKRNAHGGVLLDTTPR